MSSATSEAVWRCEHGAEGIWTFWFEQPDRQHNVLDPAAFAELGARLHAAEGEGTLRGLLIRSAKPGGFCSGVDLKTILSCRSAGEVKAFVYAALWSALVLSW